MSSFSDNENRFVIFIAHTDKELVVTQRGYPIQLLVSLNGLLQQNVFGRRLTEFNEKLNDVLDGILTWIGQYQDSQIEVSAGLEVGKFELTDQQTIEIRQLGYSAQKYVEIDRESPLVVLVGYGSSLSRKSAYERTVQPDQIVWLIDRNSHSDSEGSRCAQRFVALGEIDEYNRLIIPHNQSIKNIGLFWDMDQVTHWSRNNISAVRLAVENFSKYIQHHLNIGRCRLIKDFSHGAYHGEMPLSDDQVADLIPFEINLKRVASGRNTADYYLKQIVKEKINQFGPLFPDDVSIISGDGGFTETVRDFKKLGLKVNVISWRDCLSKRLAEEASSIGVINGRN